MGIEVHHRDRLSVDLIQRAQGRERDAVVAAQGEEFRVRPGRVPESRRAGVERLVGGGHLVEGEGVVEGGEGHVAAVEDGERGAVGVEAAAGIKAAEGGLAGGGSADSSWAEAGSLEEMGGVRDGG